VPSQRHFTIFTTRHTFIGDKWQMMSLPRNTGAVHAAGLFSGARFWFYHWLEGKEDIPGNYLSYNNANFAQGYAYWLKLANTLTVDITSSTVQHPDTVFLTLEKGWNQIANPYGYDILWDEVIFYIPEGGITPVSIGKSYQDDKPQGIWEWDPAQMGYVYHNPLEQHAVMQPWHGYWVFARRTATVLFTGKPYFALEYDSTQSLPKAADANSGWQVRLSTTQGGIQDNYNYFGMAPRARDTGKPPALFSSLTLALGNGLCEDIRGTADFVTWQCAVDNITPHAPTTLSWHNVTPVPDNYRIYLYDPTAETWTDLKAATSYTFTSDQASRTFTLLATNRNDFSPQNVSREITVKSITPHPITTSTVFSFSLPVESWAGPAILEIYSLQGKRIVALTATNSPTAIVWDGRSSDHTPALPGIYTYILKAAGHSTSGKLIKVE
jgi:hypothetical protein